MKINFENISQKEREYIQSTGFDKKPVDLHDIWALMDAAWDECGCDPLILDERIRQFYAHPVWLLNGLFIEQDSESLFNRITFANYIQRLSPKRIADFGGGYGTLARMIGSKCPDAEVFIIEPHPHAAAIELAQQTPNVKYAPDFSGTYDVIV